MLKQENDLLLSCGHKEIPIVISIQMKVTRRQCDWPSGYDEENRQNTLEHIMHKQQQ